MSFDFDSFFNSISIFGSNPFFNLPIHSNSSSSSAFGSSSSFSSSSVNSNINKISIKNSINSNINTINNNSSTTTSTSNGSSTTFTTFSLGGSETSKIFQGTNGNDLIRGNSNGNIISGLAGNDTLKGLDGNDVMNGGSGKDNLDGGNGNDVMNGGSGKDNLDGRNGEDTLTGGTNNDKLLGNAGNDILIGVNASISTNINNGVSSVTIITSSYPGRGEKDRLTGGAGVDEFILGDSFNVYYNNGNSSNSGKKDYAILEDFNSSEDKIQLNGSASDYVLKVSRGSTKIFLDDDGVSGFSRGDELIGIVKNNTSLNLSSSSFEYV